LTYRAYTAAVRGGGGPAGLATGRGPGDNMVVLPGAVRPAEGRTEPGGVAAARPALPRRRHRRFPHPDGGGRRCSIPTHPEGTWRTPFSKRWRRSRRVWAVCPAANRTS